MTFAEGFTFFLRVRRIVAIVSILAGAGTYKFGPTVWHKAQEKIDSKIDAKAAAARSQTSTATNGIVPIFTATAVATNSDGLAMSGCDLGAVSLTNHYETCVSLGKGKQCILTPKVIDSRNVQLTVAVETKGAKGKIHDLAVTEVAARLGKPLEVAVGGFSFSLTPNMNLDQ